jgi:hypothetical protein
LRRALSGATALLGGASSRERPLNALLHRAQRAGGNQA